MVKPGSPAPMTVEIHTPCRTCENCLRHRTNLWTARAIQETRAAPRTWFGTLTLTAERQFYALTRARSRLTEQGIDFDGLSKEEQFGLRHAVISDEITKYLKRVRAQAGVPLRFMMVAEAHQSGAPHYHLLVHETSPDKPVRHKVLKEKWTWGFTNFKLVTNLAQARYVCKYLAKSNLARVRASIDYGAATLSDSSNEVLVGEDIWTQEKR